MLNDAFAHKDKQVDMMHVLEIFCTSLPHALQDLSRIYRLKGTKKGGSDLAEVLRTRLSKRQRSLSSENDSALPLLTGLLEGADEAGKTVYTADLITRDMQALREAMYRFADDVPSSVAEVREAALPILTQRTRKHLHEVAQAYEQYFQESLPETLANRFKGDLKHGVRMLLEPAEAYYAHKLKAAFSGLNKTPEIKTVYDAKTLGHEGSGLYAKLEQLQSGTGVSPHDDTLVQVIAGRYGRDLSGIVESWRKKYEKSLMETVEARTYGNLRKGLLAILQSSPQHDPHYQLGPMSAEAAASSGGGTAYARPPEYSYPAQQQPSQAYGQQPPPSYGQPPPQQWGAQPYGGYGQPPQQQQQYFQPPQQQGYAPQPPFGQPQGYAPQSQPYGGGYSMAQQPGGGGGGYGMPPPSPFPQQGYQQPAGFQQPLGRPAYDQNAFGPQASFDQHRNAPALLPTASGFAGFPSGQP
jgi:hypothetical protein